MTQSDCLVSRSDFEVLSQLRNGREINYLDSAATSLTPKPVIDAVLRYYREIGANVHRGKHFLSEEASEGYEQARFVVARYLGAQANEVCFVRNATDGLNLLAAGLRLSREDLVLVAGDAHHSNLLPWRTRARTQVIRLTASSEVDLDHYAELLKRRPRVVALNHCSNVSGVYSPIRRMAEMAHEVGAIVLCDAAQSAPHRRIRLNDMGVDALVFSLHKMLGPSGVGVLCGKQEFLEGLSAPSIGGGAVDWVDADSHRERMLPYRLEPGTPNIEGVYGARAAIRYLERLGSSKLEAHDRALAALMEREVSRRPHVRMVGAGAEDRSAICSLVMQHSKQIPELTRALSDSFGIMARGGHLCAQPFVHASVGQPVLRFSAYVYNTEEEIVAAFDAFDEVYHLLTGVRRSVHVQSAVSAAGTQPSRSS